MNKNEGFTLIEVLVAMLLLSISLVLLLQLFSGGLKSVKKSEDYLRAIFYAEEKMEETLAIDSYTDNAEASGSFDGGYKWVVRVMDEESEKKDSLGVRLPVGLYRIDVVVSWESGGKEKQFEISTLKVSKKEI